MTGVEEFSGFEVIRAAMEVEKKGHQFYSTMAEKARSATAKEVFSWLAQDEVKHLRTLEALVPKYQDGAFWENEDVFLPYLRRFSETEIFPSAERLEAVLQMPELDLSALDLAIEAEERFAEYFQKAASHSRSPDGREAFSWLAGEEVRHAEVLKERKAKLVAAMKS
jgi:rubrerythrin